MPEMSFKPELDEEDYKRINNYKRATGVTKVHFIKEAIRVYLDIIDGKAKLVYPNHENERKHA